MKTKQIGARPVGAPQRPSKTRRGRLGVLEIAQIPEADFTRRANSSSSLDDDEVELLWLLAEEKVIRLDHLARLTSRSAHNVQRDVDRLARLGYIGSELVFAKDEGKPWQWLTQRGLGVIDFNIDYRRVLPSLYEFNVAFSVVETRLFYAAEHPDWLWVCERKLIHSQLCDNKRKHVPPGALEADHGLILVEVELTPRHRPQLRATMRQNNRHARTHYHCAAVARRGIEKVRESEGLERVHVFDLPGEALWLSR